MLIRFAAHRAAHRLACSLVACLAFAATARAEFAYVVSFSTGELIRFAVADPAGTRTTLVPGGGVEGPPAILEAASGMAFGPDGNLYIGVNGEFPTAEPSIAPSIVRYNVGTGGVSTVHTFSTFDVFPGSLAFRGNDLLVGRNPFYGNVGPIVRLANATGSTIAVSDYTSSSTPLASSPGLALAADGSLYVSDQTYDFGTRLASGPVKRFDSSGNYVDEVIADGASGLAGPTGLLVSGNTLYTANIGPGTILVTDLDSDATQPFGSTGQAFGAGVLAGLAGGGLLVGDPSGLNPAEIYRFDAQGQVASSYSMGLGQVGGIAISAVPEPGTYAIIAVGAGIGGALLRRRMKSR